MTTAPAFAGVLAKVERVLPASTRAHIQAVEQTRQPKACFEEANGGVLFRVDVEDLPWMARLLAGLGVPFIIHRPRELCAVVREYARTLASYAERSDA